MKKHILQTLISIETIFLFSLWVILNFNYSYAQKIFEFEASSNEGINIIKSQIGGSYLIFVLLVISYFVMNNVNYLHAAGIAVFAVMITRLLSVIADGLSIYALIALCNELVILVLIGITTNIFSKSTSKSQ